MYHNLRELLQQAEDHEVMLSEIVLQNEMEQFGITEEAIYQKLEERYAVMEKAAEKAKRKREKKGVSASSLTQAANTSTRNLQTQMPRSIKDKANVNVESSTPSAKTPPPANSLAAKAGLVQKYNEEQGLTQNDGTGSQRKKYKK